MIKQLYNRTLRPLALRVFGRQVNIYGSVAVRDRAATDLGPITRNNKKYQHELIKMVVKPGHHVIDIATGNGKMACWAAREGATVDTYEANTNQLERGRETIKINELRDSITLHHAIVGDPVYIYDNETDTAPTIYPEELPECDVLQLDCEGSSPQIIRNIDPKPPTIVVETHPERGVPSSDTVQALLESGYSIKEQRVIKELEYVISADGHPTIKTKRAIMAQMLQ